MDRRLRRIGLEIIEEFDRHARQSSVPDLREDWNALQGVLDRLEHYEHGAGLPEAQGRLVAMGQFIDSWGDAPQRRQSELIQQLGEIKKLFGFSAQEQLALRICGKLLADLAKPTALPPEFARQINVLEQTIRDIQAGASGDYRASLQGLFGALKEVRNRLDRDTERNREDVVKQLRLVQSEVAGGPL